MSINKEMATLGLEKSEFRRVLQNDLIKFLSEKSEEWSNEKVGKYFKVANKRIDMFMSNWEVLEGIDNLKERLEEIIVEVDSNGK